MDRGPATGSGSLWVLVTLVGAVSMAKTGQQPLERALGCDVSIEPSGVGPGLKVFAGWEAWLMVLIITGNSPGEALRRERVGPGHKGGSAGTSNGGRISG